MGQGEQLTEEEKGIASADFTDEELQVLKEAGVSVNQNKKEVVTAAAAPNKEEAKQHAGMQNIKAWVESHSHRSGLANSLPAQPGKGSSSHHRSRAGGLLDDRATTRARNAQDPTDRAVRSTAAETAEAEAKASGNDTIGGVPVPADTDDKGPDVSYKVNVVTKICIG